MKEGTLAPIHPEVLLRCITDTFLHFYLEEMMLDQPLAELCGLTEDELARDISRILLYGIVSDATRETNQ